ncbi:MAG: bifunctional adenosylcobinamide kinase/adenosylcobinamide-phosphate guanylyltransferase [Betaproteobacteria bacterium]|jgi:adenosylcobinamide kinase (EC 2.7.1.156)|nr:bifunctional adenosylcobinamide kinase/adenosylcobinamide-phosphate guanylyltransferase [Betaproteobacteria bacterium]
MNAELPRRHLILGGVRSGKSAYAEELARRSGLPVTYLATARAEDEEMRARIHHHQRTRPAQWRTIEEPMAVVDCLEHLAQPHQCILLDCLTLWMTHLLLDSDAGRSHREAQRLLERLPHWPGCLILVSNETGMGITPLGELTRRFGDEMGRLHQALAHACDAVTLVVAGLPLNLKGTP